MLNQTVNNHPLIYLDNSATTLKPKIVLKTIKDFYSQCSANVHRSNHHFSTLATEAYETARDTIANFINANNREIIFTSGATASLNLVANTYGTSNLNGGDEIILSIAEHHSNILPWQQLALNKNLTIKYIGLNEDGEIDLNHYKSLLSQNTKIVSISHMSNVLGYYLPIEDIINLAHDSGAKVILDACQSLPNHKVDVKKLDVDFLVASGHKMCGPNSIGILYGKYHLLNEMPPFLFGGEMIEEVDLYNSSFASPPTKFEAGTPPIAEAIGLSAAVKFLYKCGMEKITDYEQKLGEYLYQRLTELPNIEIYGPKPSPRVHRGHLVTFNHKYLHPYDIAIFMDQQGVALRAGHHCAQLLHKYGLKRSGSLRASTYIYNTFEEIDSFIEKLKQVIKLLISLHPNSNER